VCDQCSQIILNSFDSVGVALGWGRGTSGPNRLNQGLGNEEATIRDVEVSSLTVPHAQNVSTSLHFTFKLDLLDRSSLI
jgi:hypothetical protein